MEAEGENPTGHADRRLGGFERGCVRRPIFLEKFLGSRRPIELVRISFVPARLDFGKLLLALKKLVDWFKR